MTDEIYDQICKFTEYRTKYVNYDKIVENMTKLDKIWQNMTKSDKYA